MAKGKLPEDFPHLSVLNEAGIGTYAQLNKHAEDYTTIPGIGAPRAAEITAAVAASDAPEDAEVAEAAVETHICSNPYCGHEISVSPCPYCGK